MNTGSSETLTLRECAKLIGVSVATFHRWIAAGEGPKHFKFQNTIRIRREDAESWVERHTIPAGE